MEEEYRMQKSQGDLHSATGSGYGFGSQRDGQGDVLIHEDGTVVRLGALDTSGRGGADDDASTRAVHSPQESGASEGPFSASNSIPIIKVSSESDIERELAAAAANGEEVVSKENGENGHGVTSPALERPEVAAAVDQEAAETSSGGQDAFSFTNKRLCERWLDNLFMVLYEVRRSPSLAPGFEPDHAPGPARLDHLSCRSRPFQNATRRVPQDGSGMGDSGRSGVAIASQGRSQGGVSALSRRVAVRAKAVGQAVGDVCRGGGHYADDSDGDTGGCVSVCGLHRDDGGCLRFGCGKDR